MKNKKLKIIALAGVTVITAIMLTGCGSNDVKTYDKEQMNVSISEITGTNNTLEELNKVTEENNITNENAVSKNEVSNSDKPSTNGKVVNVQLQTGTLNYDEYAILHAYDEKGNEVWKYTTEFYAMTELERIQLLEDSYADDAEHVYIVEGGTIVKINKQTGDVIWKNSDFGGASVTYTFDEEDNLYIAGYYGPNLCVINKDGKTIKKLENFPDEDYYWPTEMWFVSDSSKLMIKFEGNPKNIENDDNKTYEAIVEVNTSDYYYKVEYVEVNY